MPKNFKSPGIFFLFPSPKTRFSHPLQLYLLGSPIYGHSGEPITIPTKLGYILRVPVSNNSRSAKIARHAVDLTDIFSLETVPFTKEICQRIQLNSFTKTQEGIFPKIVMLSDYLLKIA